MFIPPNIQAEAERIVAKMDADAAKALKPKTVNEMSPEERFAFEYSLAPDQLKAEGFQDEAEYVAYRSRDWGAGIPFPANRSGNVAADDGATKSAALSANAIISATPGFGEVGSEA